ncbi:MAG: NADH-quinone oxidoreductase subunit B family protein [Gammaproteobacteria bacterium]
MFRLLNKIHRVGGVSEPLVQESGGLAFEAVGARLREAVGQRFRGSLAIREVDAGSCNGCELEIHALNNVYYSIERYGIHFVASPRHADLLLVTGPVSRHMQAALLSAYVAMPEPKLVLAIGNCGADGGEFGTSYASCGAVQNVIPVDGIIRGCPPTPLALMRGILSLIDRKTPG